MTVINRKTMKKYSKPETNVMEIETQEALLSFSNIHEEESDGSSPMDLEFHDIWDVNK